eukprot:CAMPEP_0181228778 /NCGR_PEP_ID=MMETSP1096-20121128/33533_1 /TAXON_ID=156174 ORGANISM="Chrysochromulina ericina, Strain CCMP281" /NCGR_SAMPLE_ID=MMETSP1096 /ASSEMBLY_ACC=CAM_ASM_000453 /LENGTH=171 /DNA_ID=CAMNT_0023322333 /DNA_START=147 /DNA_END=663 /DNA_ORIENTATION=+
MTQRRCGASGPDAVCMLGRCQSNPLASISGSGCRASGHVDGRPIRHTTHIDAAPQPEEARLSPSRSERVLDPPIVGALCTRPVANDGHRVVGLGWLAGGVLEDGRGGGGTENSKAGVTLITALTAPCSATAARIASSAAAPGAMSTCCESGNRISEAFTRGKRHEAPGTAA